MLWLGFLLTLLATPAFAQNNAADITNTASTKTDSLLAENSFIDENKKKLNIEFVNHSEFLFYFRHTQAVEITGNESTFSIALRPNIDFSIRLNQIAKFTLTIDLYLLQALSLKARSYQNFAPPNFLFKRVLLNIRLGNLANLGFGIFQPLYKTLPMHSYFLPVVFKVSPVTENNDKPRQVGHSLITGNRDLPLPYLVLNSYDTGLSIGLHYKLLEFLTAISNGEEGLDPNSAKTVSLRLALKNSAWHSGLGMQIGNIGSVPLKEMKHAYQFFFYYSNSQNSKLRWKVGGETFLYLHGIRDLQVINSQGQFQDGYGNGGNVYGSFDDFKEHFRYVDGYFSPFSVFNNGSYDASKQINSYTLYGLSFLVYLDFEFIDLVSLTLHFSGYDPNLLSEANEMYKIRYRGFARLGLTPLSFFSVFLSFTYTYDQLFLHWSQFYDSEKRASHRIEDYDIFAGVVFRFPKKISLK